MQKKWYFEKKKNCNTFKFSGEMTNFEKLKIEGLIRENLQNSIDAKKNSEATVKVKISTLEVKTDILPDFNNFKKIVNSLNSQNQYAQEKIENMQKIIEDESVKVLTFEDFNTTGLNGVNEKDKAYYAYAYSKGFHGKTEIEEEERGGSHGVGKIASNAASDIFTMFFVSKGEDEKTYIGGSCEFIDFNYENESYNGRGLFCKMEGNDYKAYEADIDSEVFYKKDRGLKIIIPFVKEEFYNEKDILKSVCSNFYLSILEKKLEVQINDTHISYENLEEVINKNYEKNVENINRNSDLTYYFYNTLKNGEKRELLIEAFSESYALDLYIRRYEGLKSGRYQLIRQLGMKIEEKTIKSYAYSPYNIVLISREGKTEKYLKSLENESHTELSSDHIRNLMLNKKSNLFINSLKKQISDIISLEEEKRNPSEGKVDTSDIIFEYAYSFSKEKKVEEASLKIKEKDLINSNLADPYSYIIVENELSGEGELVTIDDFEKHPERHRRPITIKPKRGKERVKKIVKNPEGEEIKIEKKGGKNTLISRKLTSDLVKRGVIGDYEYLELNLEKIKMEKEECSLRFYTVDGEGIEEAYYRLSEVYNEIKDLNREETLQKNNIEINGISIKNSKINLQLSLKNQESRRLKFKYEVVI